jgi:uncharacterized protein (TIGR00297 family)
MNWFQIGIGMTFGIAAGALSYRARALTRGGALAAAIVGTLTFGIGGLAPSIMLLTFFFSSSLLSRVGARRKQAIADRIYEHGPRDHGQVLANGAIASALAVGHGWTGNSAWLFAAAGALAASNADTWATELGILAGARPRLITTLEQVAPGTSGAISLPGSLAAAGGAALIGAIGMVVGLTSEVLPVAILAGVIAAFADSLLGATLQASYHCPSCARPTERHPRHHCGIETVLIRGWQWLGNDQVNLIASVIGAILGYAGWLATR